VGGEKWYRVGPIIWGGGRVTTKPSGQKKRNGRPPYRSVKPKSNIPKRTRREGKERSENRTGTLKEGKKRLIKFKAQKNARKGTLSM